MIYNYEKYIPQIQTAISAFWGTRNSQKGEQLRREAQDQGNRGAVTGGKQLDGFISLLMNLAIDMGVPEECIYTKNNHIPGYFRPTKDWDLLIVSPSNKLLVAIELKSQVGSFGNNFNNRTEEALGSAVDLWTAFRENVFPNQQAPWVGYLMVVEKTEKSSTPVRINEPHFEVMPEFKNTGYIDRYAILCKKLILERCYTSTALMWTSENGSFGDVADEISLNNFLAAYAGYLLGVKRLFE